MSLFSCNVFFLLLRRVCHRFRLTIVFESFLITFLASFILWGSWEVANIGPTLNNLSCVATSVLRMRLLHVVAFSKKLQWWAQTKVITLKTQLHAVNARWKRLLGTLKSVKRFEHSQALWWTNLVYDPSVLVFQPEIASIHIEFQKLNKSLYENLYFISFLFCSSLLGMYNQESS